MPINYSAGKYLILTVVLFTGFVARSQNILEGYWGVKAGANVNKISKLTYVNSMKPGFHLGVFANFQVNDDFSITHEVLFCSRGVNITLKDGSTYSTSFNYIDLPWVVNFHPNKNFYITAGVQPSVYTYFKRPEADSVIYNKGNVNSLDFSYLAGAGFFASNNLGFGVRFNGSLVPLFDLKDEKNKNYVLQVFLQYAVNKKKGRRR